MTTMTCLLRSCFSVCRLPLAKTMTFNKNEEKNFNSICNTKKHVNNPVIKDKDVGGVHSSWSLSADEDYIVFCFGKDVAQENKGVKDLNHTSSRPVNRKLKYGTDEEQDSVWNIHDEHDGASVVHYHHPQLSLHQKGTQKQRDVEGIEESAESRNSDQSEGTRNSFAFPVLAWEWIGSPVQMPKSEALHLKKHKSRAVTFQCCRF